MPIKKVSKPGFRLQDTTPELENKQEYLNQYEETPEPIPPPEEEPATSEVALITFTRTTYYLHPGDYEGQIIEAKVYQSKDKPRLLLVFDLGDGLQFLHTLSIPIDRTTPIGKGLYLYCDHTNNTLIPSTLIGLYAQFEVVSADRNGYTYCNITELELSKQGHDDDEEDEQ